MHERAIPNFATEKEPKRNFLYLTDVTLVIVDIKSERFTKKDGLQQDLFDMTMVTIMFDTKSSKSESFIYLGVYDECPSYDACPSNGKKFMMAGVGSGWWLWCTGSPEMISSTIFYVDEFPYLQKSPHTQF